MANKYQWATLGKRNPNYENNWEDLTFENYKITKPTVLCLSGNSSTTASQTNGLCKIAERLLGMSMYANGEITESLYDQVDILGVVYGCNHKRGAGRLDEDEITEIVDNMFMPLCQNENGKFLPQEAIQKNLSLVSFFTFCQGSSSCYHILEQLQTNLLLGGFSLEQIGDMFSQMRQVSYAPNLIKNASFVPTVNLISGADWARFDTVKNFNDQTKNLREAYEQENSHCVKTLTPEQMQENPNMVQYTQSENGVIKLSLTASIDTVDRYGNYHKPAESIDIYTGRLLSDEMPSFDEHNVSLLLRKKEDWTIFDFEKPGGKMVPYGENADMASQIMAYSLASSVANSMQNAQSEILIPKEPMQNLMQDLNSIINPQAPINAEPNFEQ